MEHTEEVRVLRTTQVCDACKGGEMVFSGYVLTSNPPQYGHCCESCKHECAFDKKYPVITYEKK